MYCLLTSHRIDVFLCSGENDKTGTSGGAAGGSIWFVTNHLLITGRFYGEYAKQNQL